MTLGRPKSPVRRDFEKEFRDSREGGYLRDWLKSQGSDIGRVTEQERTPYSRVYYDRDTGDRYVWFLGTNPRNPHELYEDFHAFYGGREKTWDDLLKNYHQRFGFESEDTHYGGFSRGGGLARMMGGTGYGSYMPDGYQPRDGSTEADMSTDFFHDTIVPAMNAVSPLASEIEDEVMDNLYDMIPFLHPRPRDDTDPFDEPPPKRPDPGPGPDPIRAMRKGARDYSGFAPSFTGFPAKIKYNRKSNMHSVKNHFGIKRKAREWQPSLLDSAYRRPEMRDK